MGKELEDRLRKALSDKGDFGRIHPLPQSGQDVPDDLDARLVVLSTDHPYSKESGNAAERAAQSIFESRGNTPRLYRNTLVFLAVDQARLQDLDEAVRRYLAWESIISEKDHLNLDPHQVRQAETQKTTANGVVTARLPEAYMWLLVPVQDKPQDPLMWQALKLTGQDPLAVRASKKLRQGDGLVTTLAGTRLKMDLDVIPLWRGDHVAVQQLADDFARYLYLLRLRDSAVLVKAIQDGLELFTWEQDSFAYADSFDEANGRYRGLRGGCLVSLMPESLLGLLVQSIVAQRQLAAERPSTSDVRIGVAETISPYDAARDAGATGTGGAPTVLPASSPKRFHGTVVLDSARVGRDASRIAEEVIAHLSGLVGATVKVTLEVEAEIPGGAPGHVVRTVTENSRTLKFTNQGFENE